MSVKHGKRVSLKRISVKPQNGKRELSKRTLKKVLEEWDYTGALLNAGNRKFYFLSVLSLTFSTAAIILSIMAIFSR